MYVNANGGFPIVMMTVMIVMTVISAKTDDYDDSNDDYLWLGRQSDKNKPKMPSNF